MKWTKFTIQTTVEAEEIVGMVLDDHGISAIEIEDNVPVDDELQGGNFEELQPDLPEDEGLSRISFYMEEGQDYASLLEAISLDLENKREFCNMGSLKISVGETDEADWRDNWKEYFHSFTIDNILIKPTWEEISEEDSDKILIEIDPGVSFGTGKHETTQLCIRQLEKYLKAGDRVLDLGCGSGILSIAALKLGAMETSGTDIDPDCIQSTYDNMKLNHVSAGDGAFYCGNLVENTDMQNLLGRECYDIVAANILADIIIDMMPAIPDRIKPGGLFISSGIIDFKEDAIVKTIEKAGLEVLEINHQGEWVNVTARKPME
ncbi:MAG: 50S ribosomal protein L11 methyltransferase [Lachnospiraceae bacterium]|nr:50S ribosomal protein L11 methyltransferase [Lachnospiraceae bacterium]